MDKALWREFNLQLLQKGQNLTLEMVLNFYKHYGLYQDNLAFPRHILQNFVRLKEESEISAYLIP